MMRFNDLQELTNLIWFRFPVDFLQIDNFVDVRVSKDMMAAASSRKGKAERLDQ